LKQVNSRPNRNGGTTAPRRWRLALVLAVLLLAGCTASWRAPVESRGTRPAATTPAAAPAPRPRLSADQYRVQSGDTLYGIAWQHGVDYRQVAAWNGIRAPYRIYAGQVLQLKRPAALRVPPPPVRTTARSVPTPRPMPPPAVNKPKPTPEPPALAGPRRLGWHWPAQGRLLSSFEPTDPLRKGIRIGGNDGSRITAAEDGKVVYSGSGLIGYGRLIIVKHNDKYLSAYGHNRKILVREGDQVAKGQQIAEMGRANNGTPLLHFEIRRDGKPVDPLRLLPRR
jgi:lipoprotein NlpD